MTLSEDWKIAREDRALRKALVEAAVWEARTLRVGSWYRTKSEIWLAWTRLKFSMVHFCGLANLLYQHGRTVGTELRYLLTLKWRGQSSPEARQTLEQRRGWHETHYRWEKAMKCAKEMEGEA